MMTLPQDAKILVALQPRTTNAGVSVTNVNYISLKGYHTAYLIVNLTQAVGHATTVTLRRGTGVGAMGSAPGGDAAFANNIPIWLNEDAVASDALVRQTDGTACTVTNDIKFKQIVFKVDAIQLGTGYDCLGFIIGDSAQATNFGSAVWVLAPARYAGPTPLSAMVD